MTSISIGCTQRFDITMTAPLVCLLSKLGAAHYDGTCRQAVAYGGFIYGWSNALTAEIEFGGADSIVVEASNRELQLCLKICEPAPILLTEQETILRNAFSKIGFTALRQATYDERFLTTRSVSP